MPSVHGIRWVCMLAVACFGGKAVALKSGDTATQTTGDGPWLLYDPQSSKCIAAKAALLSENEWGAARQPGSRSRLPSNQGCFKVDDREACCKFIDGRSNSYKDQVCVPSDWGSTFTSGNNCEPKCWTEGKCGSGRTHQGDRIGQCPDAADSPPSPRRGKSPKKFPKELQIGGGACINFYGFDTRGSRVVFRLLGQEEKKVLHYDPSSEKWIVADEDPEHFERKQLFEAGRQGGLWCLAYDRDLCFRITPSSTTTTTTTSTSTTTTSTTTTGPTTTTITTTTTTTTTVTYAPPMWVKGTSGQNCLVVCGQEDGGRCLEDGNGMEWPVSESQFRRVLEWTGDLSKCKSFAKGDWDSFPGLYDGEICYWSSKSSKSRCSHGHYAVERLCPCQGPQWTTAAPTTKRPPEQDTPPAKPSRRRGGKGKGGKGKGGKGGRRRKPTSAPK